MKITKRQLRRIIKEELTTMKEGKGDPITLPADVVFSHTKETQQIEMLLEKDPGALPEALERLKKANMKFFNAVQASKGQYAPEWSQEYTGGRGGH